MSHIPTDSQPLPIAPKPSEPAADVAGLRPSYSGSAQEALEYWFFKHIDEGQRRELIRLVLGAGCAKEATNYGLQRMCLKQIIRRCARQALAQSAASCGEDGR